MLIFSYDVPFLRHLESSIWTSCRVWVITDEDAPKLNLGDNSFQCGPHTKDHIKDNFQFGPKILFLSLLNYAF